MEPIGIFFAAIAVLGVFGAFGLMAVAHFRAKDNQARRSLHATDHDSREMFEDM
jgi:hypothetical protein